MRESLCLFSKVSRENNPKTLPGVGFWITSHCRNVYLTLSVVRRRRRKNKIIKEKKGKGQDKDLREKKIKGGKKRYLKVNLT